jgi:hypothetical protein
MNFYHTVKFRHFLGFNKKYSRLTGSLAELSPAPLLKFCEAGCAPFVEGDAGTLE